jgi:hypothetical protein
MQVETNHKIELNNGGNDIDKRGKMHYT